MHEFYRELGYSPKITWKFGTLVFITVIVPFMILFAISSILSLPILIKRRLTSDK